MSLEYQVVDHYVRRSMEEFDRNPLARRLMRRLAIEAPESFFRVAAKVLNAQGQSQAHRMLAILLVRQDNVCERITSPVSGTRESVVGLFRRLLEVEPAFDVRLARRLPGRGYQSHSTVFDGTRSTRALDILDETSRGRRLLPILGHLTESPDAGVSAKATLFVGRRVQNPSWTKRQLERGDQRVRANAVEALWGVKTPAAVRLFEECTEDRNNRVVGNSLVGLHLVGRQEARDEVLGMSREGAAELRSTAAWVMGKILVPEFVPRLRELVRDEHQQVRSMALKSLIHVCKTESSGKAEEPKVVIPAPELIEPRLLQAPEAEWEIPGWARDGPR